jgi:transcription termination/antitermination protein NusG
VSSGSKNYTITAGGLTPAGAAAAGSASLACAPVAESRLWAGGLDTLAVQNLCPAGDAPTAADRTPTAFETQPRWIVVQTRSRQEYAASELLAASGVECFLPSVRRIRYYGHRRRVVHLPLFSCYVFARGLPHQAYPAISAKRAVRLIPVHDQDQFDLEIAQIRLALDAGADLGPYRFLTRGLRVRVTSGPFMGVEGIVEERLRQDRLILRAHAIGRALAMEIDASLLEPLD